MRLLHTTHTHTHTHTTRTDAHTRTVADTKHEYVGLHKVGNGARQEKEEAKKREVQRVSFAL